MLILKIANRIKSLNILIILLIITSCSTTQQTLYVASETKPCSGVGKMDCLLIKTNKNQPEWEYLYSGIKNFNYEKGYEYQIVVKKYQIDNPPADAPSFEYHFVKIVSKTRK